MEEEIFYEPGKLYYPIAVIPFTYGEEKMWVLHPSEYCVLGATSALPKLTSIVSFKFASVVRIVDDVQTLEPELIYFENLFMVSMKEKHVIVSCIKPNAQRTTNQFIKPKLRDEHKHICTMYKDA